MIAKFYSNSCTKFCHDCKMSFTVLLHDHVLLQWPPIESLRCELFHSISFETNGFIYQKFRNMSNNYVIVTLLSGLWNIVEDNISNYRLLLTIIPLYSIYTYFNASKQTAFENIVGKEEIACNEQFLLFPQCLPLNQEIPSPFVIIFDIISLFAAELEEPKTGWRGKAIPILVKCAKLVLGRCLSFMWLYTSCYCRLISVRVWYMSIFFWPNGRPLSS